MSIQGLNTISSILEISAFIKNQYPLYKGLLAFIFRGFTLAFFIKELRPIAVDRKYIRYLNIK